MPTFKRPAELAEAIFSMLRQREAKVEIIVIDDSEDSSAEQVVQTFVHPRLAYLKDREPSGGAPAELENLGWPKARGRSVHFLDDDDHVADGCNSNFNGNPGSVLCSVRSHRSAPRKITLAQLEQERSYFADAANY